MNREKGSAGTVYGEHRWDHVFAALYDRITRRGEKLTMARLRGELVAKARGRTLEIGAGTGANIPYYSDRVEALILAEPFEPMRRQLERKLAESGRSASTLDASAEAIPLEEESLDTVVSTLVLCTVDFPRSCAGRDSTCSAPRRPVSVHRARALELTARGPLAGSSRNPLAPLRGGMSLQPRHDRRHRSHRLVYRI
jgi:hypothetical protein